VTTCTQERDSLFGDVVDGLMVVNAYGRVAAAHWQRISRHFSHVELDAWVVMPNHVHGIIVIVDDENGGRGEPLPEPSVADTVPSRPKPPIETRALAGNGSPLHRHTTPAGPPTGSLGAIVGNFKSVTTRRINRMRHTPGARVWQRNYYERVIRDERELAAIRRYIHDNPARWAQDDENPHQVANRAGGRR
jgi:putative transposase